MQWLGVLLAFCGLLMMAASLISFGSSFRVGIDTQRPGALITSGVLAISRNPIYVAFALILIGEFLIQPRWILFIYLIAGIVLFHRQVLREERYLREHYGSEYASYESRVRRYL